MALGEDEAVVGEVRRIIPLESHVAGKENSQEMGSRQGGRGMTRAGGRRRDDGVGRDPTGEDVGVDLIHGSSTRWVLGPTRGARAVNP